MRPMDFEGKGTERCDLFVLQAPVVELNAQVEAETAHAVGFNAVSITDSEEGFLPKEATEPAYVQVRMLILVHCQYLAL